ncbi:MAG: hypothetical protein AB7H97_08165 [Pseudobdellovibrionaceae bacterium]
MKSKRLNLGIFMQRALGLLPSGLLILAFQNCSAVRFQKIPESTTEASVADPLDNSNNPSTQDANRDPVLSPGLGVCTFNGKTYKPGEEITAYYTSSVNFGSSCISEKRLCHVEGGFSGSFAYASCNVGQPNACLLGTRTIPHGGDIERFPASTVATGGTCTSEKRVCTNGNLSGSAEYENCSVNAPKKCLLNGVQVPDAGITTYQTPTVPGGQVCVSELRTCDANGVLSGSFTNLSCVVQDIEEVSTVFQKSSRYAPFKLLIIVDDSQTMSAAQAAFSSKINSLLDPLKAKKLDVDILVRSTTWRNDQDSATTQFFKANDLTPLTVDHKNIPPNIQALWDDDTYVKIIGTSLYGPGWGGSFKLRSTDTDSQVASTIAGVKSYINQLGVRGWEEEVALCPIYQHLIKQSFLQDKDRAAVVVISDEEDSSTANRCLKGIASEYGPRVTTYIPDYFHKQYKYNIKAVRITFTYDMTSESDNVFTTTRNLQGRMVLDTSVVKESDIQSATNPNGDCINLAQTHIRQFGDKVPGNRFTADFTNSVVDSCVMETMESGFSIREDSEGYDKDLCNLTNKVDGKSLAERPHENNYYMIPSVYNPRIYQGYGVYAGACSFGLPYGGPRYDTKRDQKPYVSLYHEGLSATTTNAEFDEIVYNKMVSMFGENFFVSALIIDNSCEATKTSGQSKGERFLTLKANHPSKVSTYPICSGDYSDALSGISNFITEMPIEGIVTLPAGVLVLEVWLTRIGQAPVLLQKNSQYDHSGTQLLLKIDLETQDKVVVKYTRP